MVQARGLEEWKGFVSCPPPGRTVTPVLRYCLSSDSPGAEKAELAESVCDLLIYYWHSDPIITQGIKIENVPTQNIFGS